MLNSQVLTMKKHSRASFPPPTSINGPTAHYRLQKYTVSVSHLFHLQPSRCVWAPECTAAGGGGGVSVLMQCVGGGDERPYDSNISHLLARADDGNAELKLLVSVFCLKTQECLCQTAKMHFLHLLCKFPKTRNNEDDASLH